MLFLMNATLTTCKQQQRWRGLLSLSLISLFLPGVMFVLGLWLLRSHARFAWLGDIAAFPWEFWTIALCGAAATTGGVLDWLYHRSGRTVIGPAEHRSELAALGAGGVPLFVLMAAASIVDGPGLLLL